MRFANDPATEDLPALNIKLQLVSVEDNETDAQLIARHLAKAGVDCIVHRVQTERDFASALQEIRPDLILSDFSLPQFDGLRALDIAVALAPETPFIFVSGTIGEDRAIDALRRGATDYVLKTNLSRLPTAVERALRDASLKAAQRRSEQQQGEQLRLERVARRRALDRLTRRINLVTQAAHIGVFEHNTTTGEIWWSDVMFDIFGEDPSLFRPTAESWLAHVHPDDRQRVQDNAGSAARARSSPTVHYRILRGDGSVRHIQSIGSYAEYEAGDPTRLTGVVTDITERIELQQREQTLLRQLREKADGLQESMTVHDLADTVPVVQLSAFAVEAAEDLPPAAVPIEEGGSDHELRRHLATLEETVRLRTASLERANEQLREQMRLREAVEVELGLAQKLEAVGRLAAGIAHEINTPIQYISDSVHFLGSAFDELLTVVAGAEHLSDAKPAADLPFLLDEVPGAIERIIEGTERVATIVRAMKEFAHPDATDQAPADLNRAIETTLLIARSEYKYVATVQLSCGNIPEVVCNVGELSQVFLNLIVNSAHALADAGRDAESGRITIRTGLVDGWAELQFEDNGCGIPQAIIDKIYDPFFTTKEVGRGSGQGLAIARAIVVDKHSGSISVDSTPGLGTCFTLRLPVGTASGHRF
jgi:signal transduction histidine kinase/DNA-binding response OmpR family regulator